MNTGNGKRRKRSGDLFDLDKLEEILQRLERKYSNMVWKYFINIENVFNDNFSFRPRVDADMGMDQKE